MTDIVVVGQRVQAITVSTSPGYHYLPMGWIGEGSSSGNSSSASDQSVHEAINAFGQETETAAPTPWVTAPPTGASLTDVNNHAKAIGTALSAMQDGNEHSSIIYKYGGQVLHTPIFTSGQNNSVGVDTNSLPPGAEILAVIHDHPDRNVDDLDRYPSPGDRITVAGLISDGDSTPIYHYTTNPNMLLYIFDADSGKTYVYDKNTIGINHQSCHLG